MTSPKRHHFVPRFILANFAGADGRLWVGSRATRKTWNTAPENVFVEQHRYSAIRDDGSRDPALEARYSKLEGDAKPIVDTILASARAGRPPVTSASDKRTWDAFFYHQVKRVPAVSSALAGKQGWAERLEVAIARLEKAGVRADAATLEKLRSDQGLEVIAQNAKVKALATEPSAALEVLLQASTLEVAVASEGAAFLIATALSRTQDGIEDGPRAVVSHRPRCGRAAGLRRGCQRTDLNRS